MMTARPQKIVIVGVGNILCGDEGVGVHVIEELKKHRLPDNVKVYDCGTAGLEVLELLDEADKAIIVDAVTAGMEPGKICHYKLSEINVEERKMTMLSLHELDLARAIKIGENAYKLPENIIIVGVEPKSLQFGMGLTKEIKEAIPRVVQYVLKLVAPDLMRRHYNFRSTRFNSAQSCSQLRV